MKIFGSDVKFQIQFIYSAWNVDVQVTKERLKLAQNDPKFGI